LLPRETGSDSDYDDGSKNGYGLQSVVDKPARQESSFVIKGTSKSKDTGTYTITYVLATGGKVSKLKTMAVVPVFQQELTHLANDGAGLPPEPRPSSSFGMGERATSWAHRHPLRHKRIKHPLHNPSPCAILILCECWGRMMLFTKTVMFGPVSRTK
jgi:hypothetical protein